MHFNAGMTTNIVHPFLDDPDTYAIIGAAMTVHTALGCGFLEPVYRDAVAVEFEFLGFPYEREVSLPITYRGRRLPRNYRVDFICRGVLVEIKALDSIAPLHVAQVINYLKASGRERGLVTQFRRNAFGIPASDQAQVNSQDFRMPGCETRDRPA